MRAGGDALAIGTERSLFGSPNRPHEMANMGGKCTGTKPGK